MARQVEELITGQSPSVVVADVTSSEASLYLCCLFCTRNALTYAFSPLLRFERIRAWTLTMMPSGTNTGRGIPPSILPMS